MKPSRGWGTAWVPQMIDTIFQPNHVWRTHVCMWSSLSLHALKDIHAWAICNFPLGLGFLKVSFFTRFWPSKGVTWFIDYFTTYVSITTYFPQTSCSVWAKAMDTPSLCQDGLHAASKVVQRRGDCKEGGPQNREKNCVSFSVEMPSLAIAAYLWYQRCWNIPWAWPMKIIIG